MSFSEFQSQYLSEQPLLWLALAVLFGVFIGVRIGRWLERSRSGPSSTRVEVPETSASAEVQAVEQDVSAPVSMDSGDFSLNQLAGITAKQVKLLNTKSIQSVTQLRDATASKKAREGLADELQLEDFVVNKWAKMADLLSLHDMTPEIAEFLVVAGINSTKDLASRNPESMAHKLQNLNEKEARVDSVPSRQQLESWIASINS